jgi:hypothetical protein
VIPLTYLRAAGIARRAVGAAGRQRTRDGHIPRRGGQDGKNGSSCYMRQDEYELEYTPCRIWWASGERPCEVVFAEASSPRGSQSRGFPR